MPVVTCMSHAMWQAQHFAICVARSFIELLHTEAHTPLPCSRGFTVFCVRSSLLYIGLIFVHSTSTNRVSLFALLPDGLNLGDFGASAWV